MGSYRKNQRAVSINYFGWGYVSLYKECSKQLIRTSEGIQILYHASTKLFISDWMSEWVLREVVHKNNMYTYLWSSFSCHIPSYRRQTRTIWSIHALWRGVVDAAVECPSVALPYIIGSKGVWWNNMADALWLVIIRQLPDLLIDFSLSKVNVIAWCLILTWTQTNINRRHIVRPQSRISCYTLLWYNLHYCTPVFVAIFVWARGYCSSLDRRFNISIYTGTGAAADPNFHPRVVYESGRVWAASLPGWVTYKAWGLV